MKKNKSNSSWQMVRISPDVTGVINLVTEKLRVNKTVAIDLIIRSGGVGKGERPEDVLARVHESMLG